MSNKIEFHGSDLEKIQEYYHLRPEEIVAFGSNVNPLGLSASVKEDLAAHLDIISSYPDRNYTSLKQAIHDYTGADPSHIVVGNGSTELISLLIGQRRAKKALVLGPTYSEYERELNLTGGTILHYDLKEADDFVLDTDAFLAHLKTTDVDLVIMCNPNNPTSSAIRTGEIERILAACKAQDIFVMIDETYVEFAPAIEEISAVSLTARYDNLMVIRGVSKFFAAPGLRFGYGITSNAPFLKALLIHQNPWSLNSIGAYAGERMLRDDAYIRRTRELICGERSRLCGKLAEIPGIRFYPPYGNFILVRLQKSGVTSYAVFEAAIQKGMMIRDCSSFKNLDGEYIRFCIMMPEDNDRLLACIDAIMRA